MDKARRHYNFSVASKAAPGRNLEFKLQSFKYLEELKLLTRVQKARNYLQKVGVQDAIDFFRDPKQNH